MRKGQKMILLGVGLILALSALPMHPAKGQEMPPKSMSQTIGLNGVWRFQIDPNHIGEQQGWFASGFDDEDWLQVIVPHTWNTMPNYMDYDGLAWYRLAFPTDAELEGAHLQLQFDAVFYRARVWLNDVELGEHLGGYTPFSFDVSEIVRAGEENVLAVEVDNRRAPDRIPATLSRNWSFDWWNYGGIVRDVRVLATSPVYIENQFIVAEPDLVDSAAIQVRTQIANTWNSAAEVRLSVSIRDEATGAQVWTPEDDPQLAATVTIQSQEISEIELNTLLPDPALWHFDHPYLYTLVVELRDGHGDLLHQTETSFGIRKIEIKDARFYLNGEWVRMVGLTRHADSPEYGLAETAVIMAADFDDLKRLNMVFSRPVHYPQHDFILDYCDRSGILLIPEVPAWQLTQDQMQRDSMIDVEKQQLREMIEHDFNHPSVWAWSLGNEIESEIPAGHQFVQEMIEYIKSLDPTRPVGFASNRLGGQPERDATVYADFVMMNQYFGTWAGPKQGFGPALEAIHQAWPDKLVIISEFGFEPRWNRLWGPATSTLNHEQYYFVTDEELDDQAAIDRERQKLIREQIAIMREQEYVGGAIFWTYQDYRTPSGFEMGVVNMDRERYGAYDVLREEFSPALFQRIENHPAPLIPGQPVTTQVTIWSRGPVETEMPAYTLRGYTLCWQILACHGSEVLQQGEIALPVLEPDTTWDGGFAWIVPEDDAFTLHLSIVRPNGFVSLEIDIAADGGFPAEAY